MPAKAIDGHGDTAQFRTHIGALGQGLEVFFATEGKSIADCPSTDQYSEGRRNDRQQLSAPPGKVLGQL